jgi:Mrp family chromosome partitioning ATPase
MSKHPIRFDDAWAAASALVRSELAELGRRVVLQRDLRGRISIAIDNRDGTGTLDEKQRKSIEARLAAATGAFAARGLILNQAEDLLLPEDIFDSPELALLDPTSADGPRVRERFIVGADWLRPSFEPEERTGPQRIAFFGIKGGVGRSTALAVVAQRLAQQGKSVLVLDLDLESPGVGTTLLPSESAPDFGIVDWFVEQGVGQADDELESGMVARSPLSSRLATIQVVPAGGKPRPEYSYLEKLARTYSFAPIRSDRPLDFASRLHQLVERLEQQWKPDVVLLDSRAGLHDIAAVAVTRLGATSLLFAIDTAQTWEAYRWLFRAWKANPRLAGSLVGNLKMVAGLVPETESAAYLAHFNAQSWALFSDYLYLDVEAGETAEDNWQEEDGDAPHWPVRIEWSRALQQYDPVRAPSAVSPSQLESAYGPLLEWTGLRLFGEPL